MAVLPGNKISVTDLATLAGLANGKSSLSFNVSPLYLNGSTPYGYKKYFDIQIDPANPGTSYVVGNLVSIGNSSSYKVEMVSATGKVLGIRTISDGVGNYASTAGSTTATGGSGSGLKLLSSSYGQYGPTAAYSFSDWSQTDGAVTGFYLVDGGTAYTNGDSLSITELSAVLAVASVDGAGKILTFTITTASTATTVPQDVAAMSATGGTGTGAKFGGYFKLNQNPNWLTELNRLRGNLQTEIASLFSATADPQLSISSQWPVSGFNAQYQDVDFYFPDPGYAVSVSITDTLINFALGTFTTKLRGTIAQLADSEILEFIVGGNANATLAADFYVYCIVLAGTDGVDPLTLVSVDTTNWPFGSWSKKIVGSTPQEVLLYCSYSGYVAPGRYGITVNGTVYSDTTKTSVYLQDGSSTGIGELATKSYGTINVVPHIGGTGNGSLTVSYSTATNVAGIHNSEQVKKIHLGDTLPPMLYWVYYPLISWGAFGGTLSDPVFGPQNFKPTSVSVSTTVAGLWAAKCPMVSSLNAVTPDLMPWNLQRVKYGSSMITSVTVNPSLLGDLAANISGSAKISNSYDQTLPVELQAEPPGWIANRYFTEGFTIMDGNGNLQICGRAGISGATTPSFGSTDGAYTVEPYGSDPRYNLGWACVQALTSTGSWASGTAITAGQTIKDSNGNTQFCTSAGTTGGTAPTWSIRVGSVTTDGTVQWQMRCPFTPAIHRAKSIPVYPFYWQGNNTTPTTWAATTAYALNATVIDANGNTQKCTTAGTSAGTAPAWNQTLAGTTTDGSVTWTLITLSAEANAFLKPPTATSGLTRWGANDQWQQNAYTGGHDAGWQQDNLALGWWIYSVSINRILSASGAVNVTIGCIRNGAFISFGTWNTGQTIQVLWPIFTSDALVYQCSERVDLQAVAIASGGAGVSVGSTAAEYPICAAFVSDTTALLNLIT